MQSALSAETLAVTYDGSVNAIAETNTPPQPSSFKEVASLLAGVSTKKITEKATSQISLISQDNDLAGWSPFGEPAKKQEIVGNGSVNVIVGSNTLHPQTDSDPATLPLVDVEHAITAMVLLKETKSTRFITLGKTCLIDAIVRTVRLIKITARAASNPFHDGRTL